MVTTQTINLQIDYNPNPQPSSTVVITLANPTTGTLGSIITHVHTIVNKAPPMAKVQFNTDTSQDFEDVPALQVEVDLTSSSSKAITVDYQTSGTAIAGVNYTLNNGTLTFAPGQTTQFINGTILDDHIVDPDLTLNLTLSNPVGAVLGSPSEHTHWILDADSTSNTLALFTQQFGADGGKTMTVIGPKAQTVNPGGIAVDHYGNYYITDQADGGAGDGGVLMIPKGTHNALRIITGLNAPTGIQLSPDQRTLIVAEAAGNVSLHVLGVSVSLINGNDFSGGILYVKTDEGSKTAKISPDGYFHVPNILTAGQTSPTVDIVLERAGITRIFYKVPLGQPGSTGSPYGQTLVSLQF
jgi:hypothetical protein